MLLPTLLRTVGSSRIRAFPSLSTLTAITRRGLFYPTASPPLPNSSASPGFPPQSRAHLSSEQFDAVRNSGNVSEFSSSQFEGLIEKDHLRPSQAFGATPEERWADQASRHDESPPGPYAGRTIEVRTGEGIGPAYAKLQSILRTNNVRQELRLAERHEKKGVKRRRLRSERWRRKFADEVRKKVKLVTEIRMRDRMWGARH